MPGDPSLSIYFHFPFCNTKCPYCHFAIFPNQLKWHRRFLTTLFLEWDRLLAKLQGRPVVSLYFGGGTPTLFPDGIVQVLQRARAELSLVANCEITVEANPESLSLPIMHKLKEAGVNRLSLGIQSFDHHLLKVLGREHSAQRGIDAIVTANQAGISNLTIDLMYELPYQTETSWKKTLAIVATLPITHISLYNLTFEPSTSFNQRQNLLKPFLPSEKMTVALLKSGVAAFKAMGLEQYEISAFAKPGYQSVHNSGYWQGRSFFGLGPSAFSYSEGKRWRNTRALPRYVQALEKGTSSVDFEEKLSYPANVCELLAIGLRLTKGIDLAIFEQRFGLLPLAVYDTLTALAKAGWLTYVDSKVKLTKRGQLVYDSVAEELIIAE
ncbi:MAG: radical SAM family heme chaperone HemW [Chlamydiota bacterium]